MTCRDAARQPTTLMPTRAIALAAAIALTGCGGEMATINGSVTLDGELLRCGENTTGIVIFQNTAGGPKATGAIDESGDFRVSIGGSKYVAPGAYTATVSAKSFTPPADGVGPPDPKRITPRKYGRAGTAGLKYDIVKGGNRIDIALTTE